MHVQRGGDASAALKFAGRQSSSRLHLQTLSLLLGFLPQTPTSHISYPALQSATDQSNTDLTQTNHLTPSKSQRLQSLHRLRSNPSSPTEDTHPILFASIFRPGAVFMYPSHAHAFEVEPPPVQQSFRKTRRPRSSGHERNTG